MHSICVYCFHIDWTFPPTHKHTHTDFHRCTDLRLCMRWYGHLTTINGFLPKGILSFRKMDWWPSPNGNQAAVGHWSTSLLILLFLTVTSHHQTSWTVINQPKPWQSVINRRKLASRLLVMSNEQPWSASPTSVQAFNRLMTTVILVSDLLLIASCYWWTSRSWRSTTWCRNPLVYGQQLRQWFMVLHTCESW